MMRGTPSIRRTGQQCFGMSGMMEYRSVHFLHSKEGVTQGDPLAMIA